MVIIPRHAIFFLLTDNEKWNERKSNFLSNSVRNKLKENNREKQTGVSVVSNTPTLSQMNKTIKIRLLDKQLN